LEWLQVSGINLTVGAARALGEAMQCGALPNLRHIDASWNLDVRDEGMRPLLMAMKGGKVPFIQAIDISSTCLGLDSISILIEAMKEGAVNGLVELLMGENYLGDDGLIMLAEAFEKGAGQQQ